MADQVLRTEKFLNALLSLIMNNAISKVKEYLKEAELEKIAKTLITPSHDEKVRTYLRFHGEPITLFGEDRADRRARLRKVMAARKLQEKPVYPPEENESEDESPMDYTVKGSAELRQARLFIAEDSVLRSQARLNKEKSRYESYKADEKLFIVNELEKRRQLKLQLAQITPYGSQSGFERPVSALRFNPIQDTIATADWSGVISLFDQNSLEKIAESSEHNGKVTGLAWGDQVLASGAQDGQILLHDSSLNKLSVLPGHTSRVAKLDFHPTAKYLASAGYDEVWKLWDCETSTCLLSQPGHSKPLYTVSFHPDGNLLLSGGLDGIGRVWDLRSGKSVLVLDGHLREIYSSGWSFNGYTCLTGGADNNVFVWDLRQGQKTHEIPAHQNIVSDLRVTNDFVITTSYDQTVRFWDCDTWELLRSITIGEKVLSADYKAGLLGLGRWDRAIDIYS